MKDAISIDITQGLSLGVFMGIKISAESALEFKVVGGPFIQADPIEIHL